MYGLILVILIIYFIVSFIIYKYFNAIKISWQIEMTKTKESNKFFDVLFSGPQTINCHDNKLPCIMDEDCRQMCSISANGNQSSCNDGYCGSSNNFNDVATYDCNNEHGIVKVFIGREFIAEQLCISTLRDVYNDDDTLKPYVCDNGEFSFNYLVSQITSENCNCSSGYTKFLYEGTTFTRQIPICIPNNLKGLYARIYKTD